MNSWCRYSSAGDFSAHVAGQSAAGRDFSSLLLLEDFMTQLSWTNRKTSYWATYGGWCIVNIRHKRKQTTKARPLKLTVYLSLFLCPRWCENAHIREAVTRNNGALLPSADAMWQFRFPLCDSTCEHAQTGTAAPCQTNSMMCPRAPIKLHNPLSHSQTVHSKQATRNVLRH